MEERESSDDDDDNDDDDDDDDSQHFFSAVYQYPNNHSETPCSSQRNYTNAYSLERYEEFHRKTSYIHFCQF